MPNGLWPDDAPCDGCGGGVDGDHPTTCSACRYEQATGRSYERDVDAAHDKGLTLREWYTKRFGVSHDGRPEPAPRRHIRRRAAVVALALLPAALPAQRPRRHAVTADQRIPVTKRSAGGEVEPALRVPLPYVTPSALPAPVFVAGQVVAPAFAPPAAGGRSWRPFLAAVPLAAVAWVFGRHGHPAHPAAPVDTVAPPPLAVVPEPGTWAYAVIGFVVFVGAVAWVDARQKERP